MHVSHLLFKFSNAQDPLIYIFTQVTMLISLKLTVTVIKAAATTLYLVPESLKL